MTLPDREYELAGRLLSDAVAESARTGGPVLDAVNRTFADYGAAAGRAASADAGTAADPLDAAAQALARHGYEPRRDGDRVDLHNCPFHALAQAQTELICTANQCLVAGLVDALAPDRLTAKLEPDPHRCCVVLEKRT